MEDCFWSLVDWLGRFDPTVVVAGDLSRCFETIDTAPLLNGELFKGVPEVTQAYRVYATLVAGSQTKIRVEEFLLDANVKEMLLPPAVVQHFIRWSRSQLLPTEKCNLILAPVHSRLNRSWEKGKILAIINCSLQYQFLRLPIRPKGFPAMPFGKNKFLYRTCRGLQQGSILSPLLAALLLGYDDFKIPDGGSSVLVRYADDFLFLSASNEETTRFLERCQNGRWAGCQTNSEKFSVLGENMNDKLAAIWAKLSFSLGEKSFSKLLHCDGEDAKLQIRFTSSTPVLSLRTERSPFVGLISGAGVKISRWMRSKLNGSSFPLSLSINNFRIVRENIKKIGKEAAQRLIVCVHRLRRIYKVHVPRQQIEKILRKLIGVVVKCAERCLTPLGNGFRYNFDGIQERRKFVIQSFVQGFRLLSKKMVRFQHN